MNLVGCITQVISYITEGYISAKEAEIQNERALMNALYRNECATLRKIYGQTHKRP